MKGPEQDTFRPVDQILPLRKKERVESIVDPLFHQLLAADLDQTEVADPWSKPGQKCSFQLLQLGQIIIAPVTLLVNHIIRGHFGPHILHAMLDVVLGEDCGYVGREFVEISHGSSLAKVTRVVQPAQLREHTELL